MKSAASIPGRPRALVEDEAHVVGIDGETAGATDDVKARVRNLRDQRRARLQAAT